MVHVPPPPPESLNYIIYAVRMVETHCRSLHTEPVGGGNSFFSSDSPIGAIVEWEFLQSEGLFFRLGFLHIASSLDS